MFGQLTRQQETDSGLHLAGSDGGALVVLRQTRGLGGDAFEDVVHERVHDGHGLRRHAGVGVHLLQHLVDVDREGLLALAAALLLVRGTDGFLGLAGLLHGFAGAWWGHSELVCGFEVVVARRTGEMASAGTGGRFYTLASGV